MGSVAKVGAGQKEAQVGGKALERLLAFIEERRRRAEVSNEEGSEAFEREVRGRFAEAEREFVGEELERLDVTVPQVRIEGVLYRRVVSGSGEYMTVAGPVKVLRHRYRAAGSNGHSECPLELRAGIVEGFFMPLAAYGAVGGDASHPGRRREAVWRAGGMSREFVRQNSSVLTADVLARCAGLAASDAGPGRQEPPGRTPVPSRCA